jgi:acetate kinase
MHILVINCGSSSIKSDIINSQTGIAIAGLHIERVQEAAPLVVGKGELAQTVAQAELISPCPMGLSASLAWVVAQLKQRYKIGAVGHRVVHGGTYFDQPTLITADVLAAIDKLAPLAPLHNPANAEGIRVAQNLLPDLPHVAVFDTAFHQTMPKRAITYALPKDLRERFDLRRYGFHGTSHQYVCQLAAQYLEQPLERLRIISCHLGSGASVAAVEYGRSVETSMGLTPLEGLVMGTRAGDIDAGLLLHLAREGQMTLSELDVILNKESGLKGLANGSSDMRDILQKATEGDDDARLALQVFSHRLRKYIGAYAAVMGGVDVIIFTGGIGENSPTIRHRATQRLDFLGAVLDEDLNHDLKISEAEPVADFSAPRSSVRLLTVRTDEQKAISQQTAQVAGEVSKVNKIPAIPIAISARHVHLCQETVEKLFGKGYQLTEKAPLSQPGQFACNEQVDLVGPRNTIERVRVLGPTRPADQVEVSRTDEFFLGLDAPIRESGKVENTPGIKLVGAAGEVTIPHGVICAWRHIHMHPNDAELFGVADKDIVEVAVGTGDRPLTFGNVLVRVSEKFKLEMHIDTDEANAAELSNNTEGALLSTNREATLLNKKIR